jgi:ribosomal protein S11
VQTNYSIGFSTQPPAQAVANVALSPAPVVSLFESGNSISVSGGTVSMSDSASLLGGTTTAGISGGAASFGNLTITGATTGDILTASLQLNGALSISTVATTGVDALLSQTITFGAIAAQPVFSTYALSASASSGLPITYYTNTPSLCTINGNTVTLDAIGYCGVFASQPGNSEYAAAAWVGRNIEVVKAAQTITFPAISSQPVSTTFTLTATASSGLPITYTSSTPSLCTISGGTVNLLAPGYCGVYASQSGNSNYMAATTVGRDIEIVGVSQTINFPAISPQQVNTTFTLSATASSGLPVTFTSTTPALCTVSGNMASLLAPGYCGIEASQSGNSTYAAATAGRNIEIVKASQTITFPAMSPQPVNTTYTLPATASSGLPITYTSTTPSICTINGGSANLLAKGYCGIYASQPGNSNYSAATTVGRNLQVVQ